MKILICSLISLLTLCEFIEAAGGPLQYAKTRAALYQAEVREALVKHQWHIAAESSGIFVADHTLLDQEASVNDPRGQSGYTRAVIQFKPKSNTDTACSASVLSYVGGYYLTADLKKYHGHPPTPSDPSTVKAMENIINDARAQLVEKHPEYAKAGAK